MPEPAACPRARSMYRSAFASDSRSSGSAIEAGSGTAPVIGIPMPGLVPKVTIGSSASASMVDFAVVDRAFVASEAAASAPAPRPNPRPSARTGGRTCSDRSYRPARSGPPARRPRSTYCRPSCALPSTAPEWPSRVYSNTQPVPPPMPIRAISARIISFAETPGFERAIHPHLETSSMAAAAGTAWPARAPLRWCRCRTPARRKRRAWRCGCRRKPPSCPAA